MTPWQRLARWATRASKEPISDADIVKAFHGGGGDPWTGLSIDRLAALGLPVVWACVRVLAETLASLPLITFERVTDGKQRADAHPLYDRLHVSPNPQQTAFGWKEQLQGHLGIFGNAYCNIVRKGSGYVKELWPLDPDLVSPFRKDGELLFEYKDRKTQHIEILSEREMFHVSGLSFDGIRGYAPLEINQQTWGLAQAAKRWAAEFYANGGQPDVVIKLDKPLSEAAIKRMGASWKEAHTRWGNKHAAAILEQGSDIRELSATPDKAQNLETQLALGVDICRFYRMQPHMVQILNWATYTNIEWQGLEFVTHTMRPWCVRWEQAISMQLLSEADRKRYFGEFLMDALLRGDMVARYTAYRTAMEIGALTANEVREMENRNEREGGDTYYAPINWMATSGPMAGKLPGQPDEPPADKPASDQPPARSIETRAQRSAVSRSKVADVYEGLFTDAAGRIVRKERRDLHEAIEKLAGTRDLADFQLWLGEYYRKFPDFIKRQIAPVYASFSAAVEKEVSDEIGRKDFGSQSERDQFLAGVVDAFTKRYIGSSRASIDKLTKEAAANGMTVAEVLDGELDKWETERPAEVARNEKVQASNAFAKNLYRMAGIMTLVWVANQDACPFCAGMSGRTTNVAQPFVYKGDEIPADRALHVSKSLGHPPLHTGCQCQIMAGG